MKNATFEEILPFTDSQKFFRGGAFECSAESMHVYGYRLCGEFDANLAEMLWREIVAAYPSLRTSLHVLAPNRTFQVVHGQAEPVVRVFDLTHLSPEEQERVVEEYQSMDSVLPFDWHSPPLIRLAVHKLNAAESILSITIDHLIFDGWSLGLAIRDFLEGHDALRSGQAWNLEPKPSVRDYIEWHKRADSSQALLWYRNKLGGMAAQKLPFVECREWPDEICASEVCFLPFTEEEDRILHEGANRMGVTLYVVFQAAWSLILSQCQENESAYFISTASSRPAGVPGIQSMFGLLLGVIPHHFHCPRTSSVGDWLDGIRAYQVESMDYHFVPPRDIIAIQEELAPRSQTSCLVFQNMDTGVEPEKAEEKRLTIAYGGLVTRSNYPLVVSAQIQPALQLSLMYDARIFAEQKIVDVAELLKRLMLQLGRDREATLAAVCESRPVAAMLQEIAQSVGAL